MSGTAVEVAPSHAQICIACAMRAIPELSGDTFDVTAKIGTTDEGTLRMDYLVEKDGLKAYEDYVTILDPDLLL
jgi:hypothetical protein